MFKIHQRYLAATFIPPFVLATAFFVFFLLTFYLLRFTGFLVNKGVTWGAFGLLLAHMGVMFLPFAVPIAVLLATIYTLNKLSEDSEIVAMRSFGISREKLFTPFLVLGVLIAGTLFSLNKNIIPFSYREVRNMKEKLASNAMLKQIRPEEFFGDIPGLTLYASSVSNNGRRMKNIYLFRQDKKTKEEKIIFAQEGALIGGKDTISNLKIELKQGTILRRNPNNSDVEKISFEKYSFLPFKKAPGFGLLNKASMRSNISLRKELARVKKAYHQSLKSKKNINGKKREYFYNLIEYYWRFNTPLVVLACIFLGFSVGIKNGRGRDKNSVLLAFMVLIPYYGVFFWGISKAKGGFISPSLAVFGPTVLFFMAGYWFYRKVNWVS